MRKTAAKLAKLSRPRLYRPLERERLFALLDEKRTHPAVWISGPPGAGKTTLVASYLDSRKLSALWVQVDAGDSDVSSFFYFLTEAARSPGPGKRPLPLLTPEYLPDVLGFARRYFRELFARMPKAGMLVLDNCQELPDNGPLFEVIGVALAEVPEYTTVILISRTEPPDNLFPHLANGNLAAIGWQDLRLSFDEALAFSTARSALDTNDIRDLFQKTGGWMAGLALMLERVRRGELGTGELKTASQDAVFKYFATQILNAASDSDQHTILSTSLFDDFTGDDAIQISGSPDAAGVLDELCRRNLFTYRRSSERAQYQYHDLFREFLSETLKEVTTPKDLRELCRRAAELSEAGGRTENAVGLFAEAREWESATRVILDQAPVLLAQGRWKTLKDWVGRMPTEQVRTNPWLLYWLGSACLQEDRRQARAVFIEAFDSFDAADPVGQILCAAAIIRTYHFEYNTFEPMDRWVAEIDRLLSRRPRFPSVAAQLAVYSAVLVAVTFRLPAHPLRVTAVEQVTRLLETDIDPNQKVPAAFALVLYHTLAHELARAQPVIALIDPLTESPELTALNRAYWWLFLSYHYHRAGERRKTEEALDRSDRIAAESGLRQTEFISHCYRSYHSNSWGDVSAAARALAGIESTVSDSTPMLAAQYHNAMLFVAFNRQDGAASERHARRMVEAAGRLGAPFFRVAWMSFGPAGLAMNGAYREAEKWLDDAWQEADNGFLITYRPAILMTRAYVALLQGQKKRAHETIRQLFAIAHDDESLSYLRTIPMVKNAVLAEALEAGIEAPLVRNLVRRWQIPPPEKHVKDWPWPVRIYTLGSFGIEVDDEPLAFARKVPKRPLNLLKALIAFGGRHVPEQKLIDSLWSDEDGEAAGEAFAVSLYRLRKMLVHPDVVQLSDGWVSLDPDKCWVDAWALEQQISQTELANSSGPLQMGDPVLRLYRGHFMAEHMEAAWALSMRERLRGQFLRYLSRTGRRQEDAGRLDLAVLLYQKGIETDDLAEELYQGLMRTLNRLGRRAEAMAAFRRLRQTLSVTLGISPSSLTESLFDSIQREN